MTEIGFKKRVDKSNTRRGVGRKAREKILICTTGVAGRLQFFVLMMMMILMKMLMTAGKIR